MVLFYLAVSAYHMVVNSGRAAVFHDLVWCDVNLVVFLGFFVVVSFLFGYAISTSRLTSATGPLAVWCKYTIVFSYLVDRNIDEIGGLIVYPLILSTIS